jgi:hypothetical protein
MSKLARDDEQTTEIDELVTEKRLSMIAKLTLPEQELITTWTMPIRPAGITHSNRCEFKTKAGEE